MTDKRLYNSRIINTFVKLVEKKYHRVDLHKLLHDAGIEPYEVSDEGHWFTQGEVDLFYERLVQATGNPGIAREAGQYGASVESLGFMRKYLLGLIGPANAFIAIKTPTSNLTRSSVYEARKIATNKVEITVTPLEGLQESSFQCENRLGFFEAILTTFNCSIPVIEHPECMFKGSKACRYLVSWKETPYIRIRTVRSYLALTLLFLCAAVAPFYPWQVLTGFLPLSTFLLLVISYLENTLEKRELYTALSSLKETTDELLDQAGVNYNNALMVNEVGQAISKQAGIDEVLENVIKALENRLSYDRGLILLADPTKTKLEFRTGFGYSEEDLSVLRETTFNLTNRESRGVFVACFHEQKPILINDFADISSFHSSQSLLFAEKIGARSFICCAIVCEGESLGILAVDNIRTKKALVQSDLSLVMGIAPVIGMSIRNAMYIERERQRDEQMRQSQKMEAIGQLAGGIAHDFNNLLTAIIGFASLAQMEMDPGNPAAEYLNEVLAASDRATHLTQGMLAFSRKQAIHLRPDDLNRIIGQIEKLLRRLISEEIELVIVLNDEPLPVVVDAGQIDQIMLNLATNARDAMENTGILTIETSSVELSADFVAAHGYGAAGRYARLAVSDTGMGMDDATRAHIFEPFFTTKEVGKGTGLGLAIVYGIVKQHSGYIEIDTEPGKGTTFNIYFPLQQKDALPGQQADAPQVSLHGTGTVLVVEDSPEVRKLTRQILESHGYQVIEAVDGQDAVEKFLEHQEAVKLVIMDVVMPRMNGKEAFAEIDKIRPGTKVLFTSGYTPDDVNRKGIRFEKDNFLAKPSSPQALLRKVRDLLA
jgi:signal transduction histidine kinase/CheY-like chemotaxis protein/arsenate reductase-like glutaredoxin family protein